MARRMTAVRTISSDEGPCFASEMTHPKRYAHHLIRTLKRVPTSEPPKGTMIFLHGTLQHSRSVETLDVQDLFLKDGISWFGLDAPGHGLSGRLGDAGSLLPAGLIPSFAAYVRDALHIISSILTDDDHARGLPFVVGGHSLGTLLLVHLIPALQERFGDRFMGACMSACALAQNIFRTRLVATLATPVRLLSKFLTCLNVQSSPVSKEKVAQMLQSRDEVMRTLMANDQLRARTVPWPTINALATAMHIRKGTKMVKSICVPLYISHGDADTTTEFLQSIAIFMNSSTPWEHKHLQILSEAHHNLFADPKRDEIFTAWINFVRAALIEGKFVSQTTMPTHEDVDKEDPLAA